MAVSVQPYTTPKISGVVNNYGTQTSYSGVPTSLKVTNNPVNTISGQVASNQDYLNNAQSETTRLTEQIKNMIAQQNQKVYAPKLDFASINSQARSAAENAVNPYYTKTLNDFLTQQAAKRTQYETQNATNVQNLQDTLKQTLEANALNKERTGADVALNQEQINTQNDQNQVDTGTQFEDQRLADAKALAIAGVLGSGAGNRATGAAQTANNTAEGRQNAKFQEQRNQQELFKTRTFEDLAKSGELATANTAKGEKQAKFDLDSYIQNLGFEEQNQRNSLDAQRQAEIDAKTAKFAQDSYASFIRGITDPRQALAAAQKYGSSF